MEPEQGKRNLLSRRCRMLALGAALLFFAALTASGQTEEAEISVLGVKNPLLVSAANDAFTRALRKLAHTGCQRIFTDFHDPKGRPLQGHLDSLGRTAPDFLRILRFANGDHADFCQPRGVLAATTPLSHVIFLCGARFFEKEHRDPEFAASLVIHEMLHSLGLGENPPTSLEITSRVIERCGTAGIGEVAGATAQLRLSAPTGPGLLRIRP
jgi:hypothetical protein